MQDKKFQLDNGKKKIIMGELNTGISSPRSGGATILRDIQNVSGYKALSNLIKVDPALFRGDGLDDLQRSLLTSVHRIIESTTES